MKLIIGYQGMKIMSVRKIILPFVCTYHFVYKFSIHSLNSHLFSVSVNWKQISKRIDIGIGRYLSSSIDIGIGREKVVLWHP